MQGSSVTVGYWNREEETAEAFRGGWFTPATSGSCIPTATSSCATARRT
jgi:acyl-CoA synthetase (AMP-forming)/AMP-acid ligase II